MPADAPDPQGAPRVELWSVAFGRFSLVIGDRRGGLVDDPDDGSQTPTREGRSRAGGQHAAAQTRAASLERAVAHASKATDKLEQVVDFIARLVQRKLDVDSLDQDAEGLIETARRHSHNQRWDDVLELARALAMLLALLERWEQLLQSLELSIHAAEQLGDVAAEAWGHHELGTVHLLKGDHAKADSSLAVARRLRERIGDWDALAVTDFNLQVLCRALRARLHEPAHPDPQPPDPPPRRRRLVTLGLAAALLVIGGAAGAAIGHAGSVKKTSRHPTGASTVSLTGAKRSKPSPTTPASPTIVATPKSVPVVVTRAASEVTATAATLNGTLNPNGTTVESCHFQYGAGGYEHSVACSSQRLEGSSPIHVSASVLDLTPDTAYRVRLVAGNASGQTDGESETFKTHEPASPKPSEKPTVEWLKTQNTDSGKLLEGSVDPSGTEIEACYFEFTLGEAHEERAPCSPSSVGSGTAAVTVSAQVSVEASSLRLIAKNAGGTAEAEPPPSN